MCSSRFGLGDQASLPLQLADFVDFVLRMLVATRSSQHVHPNAHIEVGTHFVSGADASFTSLVFTQGSIQFFFFQKEVQTIGLYIIVMHTILY